MTSYLICLIVGALIGVIGSVWKMKGECKYCAMHERYDELF